MRELGLGVVVLAVPPGQHVALESPIEAGPLEGALGPIPGGVFAGAELEDLGGGLEEEGVD